MPLFALANAGVTLRPDLGTVAGSSITLGVLLGLFIGKPTGILAACWLAVRFRLAETPDGVGWGQLAGVAVLCGIGFTMSLFIATLAFDPAPALLADAKVGVLSGSILAGTVGAVVLARCRLPGPH